MDDPALLIAAKLAAELSREIEVDLGAKKGPRPVLYLLTKMRDDATRALANLAYAETMEDVRASQAQVQVFIRTVEHLQHAFANGYEAEFVIADEEQEELKDLIGKSPEEEQQPQGQED